MPDVIVALDHDDPQSAVALLDLLPESTPVKVGAVLLARAGTGFVRSLIDAGHPVFLDPKWHDIPNTVAGAVRAAAALGVDMVTVHALGGTDMLTAAVDAAGGNVAVVAVTVLTSHSGASFAAAIGRPDAVPAQEVQRLTTLAVAAGVAGVVCSPREVALVRSLVGGGRIVVPGIRREADAAGDQQRIATPEAAVAGGATHLVVGLRITGAQDPAAAYRAFAEAAAAPARGRSADLP